jgi:SpoIID/LytB domain protein
LIVLRKLPFIWSGRRFLLPCLLLLGVAGCTVPPRLDWVRQPQIRVGILEGRQQVDFISRDGFTIRNFDGSFVARGVKGQRWRASVVGGQPAPRRYRLLVTTSRSEERAADLASNLTASGLPAKSEQVRKEYPPAYLGRKLPTTYRVVLEKTFADSAEAVAYQHDIQSRVETRIFVEPTARPKGRLVLTNLEDPQQRFESTQPIRISATYVAILDVEYGTGYHWASSEHRAYGGMLEFVLDKDARITVVNLLPLETYLAGVVPAEMPKGFPLEALKAQAVAARTEALSMLGVHHQDDPYDVDDDVHCQVYGGVGKESPSTTRAVLETRGLVMKYNGRLINAVYSAVCGGHTENNENVWAGDPQPYLRGVLDADASVGSLPTALRDEETVRRWIESYPDVYCNTVTKPVPPALEYTKKYFRWQVQYSRTELEEILRQKTGRSFGKLVDLVPLERGVSGRIIRLRVVGTEDSFVLQRELTIRRSLSRNTLYSAAFVVDKEPGPDGLSDTFVLKGAGWGHGVGMCQTGAAGMALAGKRFDEILRHYYRGIELEQIY